MLDYINGLKLPDMKIPEFDWAKDHRRRSFCLGPPSHLSKDIKAIQIGIHPKLCCKGLHNLTFRAGSPYKESDHVLHQEVNESKCAEARQYATGSTSPSVPNSKPGNVVLASTSRAEHPSVCESVESPRGHSAAFGVVWVSLPGGSSLVSLPGGL